jgi:predicted transcriptional regulator
VEVPQPSVVFTVKLPVQLVARVRAHAAGTGRTISSVVVQALEEFLSRGRREHPRR